MSEREKECVYVCRRKYVPAYIYKSMYSHEDIHMGEWERERVYVCVCAVENEYLHSYADMYIHIGERERAIERARESERERERERKRERKRERERERERERQRERERERLFCERDL